MKIRKALAWSAGGIAVVVALLAVMPDPPPRSPERVKASPRFPIEIERSQVSDSVFYTISHPTSGADDARLVLVCGGGEKPGIQIYTGRRPPSPPPLRGVYGVFTVDEQPERGFEIAYLEKDSWFPRDEMAEKAATLVRAIARARTVRFKPPIAYAGGDLITWQIPEGPSREAMRKACAA